MHFELSAMLLDQLLGHGLRVVPEEVERFVVAMIPYQVGLTLK
jgi:hypothetical protein